MNNFVETFSLQVLASNMIFLGVVVFLPFQLGRIVLSIASQLAVTTSDALLTGGMSSATGSDLGLKSVVNASATTLTKELLQGNMSAGMPYSGSLNATTTGGSVEVLTEALLVSLRDSDAATLYWLHGHFAFCCMLSWRNSLDTLQQRRTFDSG